MTYDKDEVYALLRKEFAGSDVEIALNIELTAEGKISNVIRASGSRTDVKVDLTKIDKSKPMILAHCHPIDAAVPSTADRKVVMRLLQQKYNLVDVLLYSNFLANERIFSWVEYGLLQVDQAQVDVAAIIQLGDIFNGYDYITRRHEETLLAMRHKVQTPG